MKIINLIIFIICIIISSSACKKEEITVAKHNGKAPTDSIPTDAIIPFDVSEGQNNWTKIPYDTLPHFGDNLAESSLLSIAFNDNQVGFIGGYIYAGQYDKVIKKTLNGGVSWNTLHLTGAPPFRDERISNILILSPNHLLLESSPLYSSSYRILESKDGGNTWFNSTNFNSCNCTVIDSLHLLCDSGKTNDGGITWEPVTYPYNTSNFIFNDTTTGYSLGLDGIVARTIDGGITWDTLFNQNSYGFSSIYVNGTTIIVGGSAIFKSIDGGISWQNTYVESFITDIKFVTPLIGFATRRIGGNSKGEILKTIDGGNSWAINYTSSFIGFKKLCVLDQNTIIAVGSQKKGLPDLKNMYIVKTTTQGE